MPSRRVQTKTSTTMAAEQKMGKTITVDDKGHFVRAESVYRSKVTTDGSSGFKTEAGRYHIFLSEACPWCTRTEIMLRLKGLTEAISISYVHPIFQYIEGYDAKGWVFNEEVPDKLYGAKSAYEIYKMGNPEHNSKCTVPIFWDKQTKKVVNNESSDILQFLNTEFQAFAKHPEIDIRPAALVKTIEEWNDFIYPRINNGVYRAGFATSQEAYNTAVKDVFEGLDKVEEHLSKNRYMAGSQITETDIRLFVTLIRFDPVYVCHFKCLLRRVQDYPNILNYTRELYAHPAFKAATFMDKIKEHYYGSHRNINPLGIIPITDMSVYEQPHDRDSKFPKA